MGTYYSTTKKNYIYVYTFQQAFLMFLRPQIKEKLQN